MAYQGRIGAPGGLSQREVRQVAKRTSPLKKLYDEGQTPEDLAKLKGDIHPEKIPAEGVIVEYGSPEYMKYLGVQPMRISPSGEVTILPDGSTMFDHPATSLDVTRLEKSTVVQQKDAWVDWDHRGRARKREDGEIPEWDHMALWSMTRREGSKLAIDPETIKEINRIVVDEFRRSQDQGKDKAGNPLPLIEGAKDMFLMPVHYDTDNVHLQAFVNRIPWDFEGKVSGKAEKENSFFDNVRARINQRLKAAEIPLELHGAPSASLDRKADVDDVTATVRLMEEAELDVPPELTIGRPKERVLRIVDMPELERHEEELTAELLDITRRQNLLTGALKQVQGAKALYVENATLKDEKAALEADLSETKTILEETSSELSKASTELDGARGEVETLTEQVTAATAKIAEQVDQIETLEGEKTELKADLDEARQQLAQTDAALEQERAGRAVDVKKAAETEAVLKSQVEELTKALDDERTARKAEAEAATKAIEQAQKATQETKGELQAERDTFLERARAWADEHVKSPLVAQIDTLKEELAEARRSFAAEMADAQRQFMTQIRELTASIRPQQAEQAAPARQRQQWPSWSQKSFAELTSAEKTAAQKALDSEIKAGRMQEGLRLADFHRIVNDRWREQQASSAEQNSGPKPKL